MNITFTAYDVLTIIVILWNIAIIILYGADKSKARRGKWRISEATLIIPAFFAGALGAMLGMIIFNHKTSKPKFRVLIPTAFLVNIAQAAAIAQIFI